MSEISWAEAADLAKADADEMDRRRTALAEREASIHDQGYVNRFELSIRADLEVIKAEQPSKDEESQ